MIIWATPLYHNGMTSIMKRFLERTLLLNKPEIIEEGGAYTHPLRYNANRQEHVLISNCGFPAQNNFEVLIDHFRGGPAVEILTGMGELFSLEAEAAVSSR